MAIRDVVLYPDPPLTEKAAAVERFGPELEALAQDMLETMRAFEGVGLAGPQIGLSQRIFVMHAPDEEPMCLVNPEILEMEGREEGEEGCLSMPQVFAAVPRATRIRVRAMNEHGEPLEFEARDFKARIIQHEYDHLNGILFPERLDILSRESVLRDWEEVRARLVEARSAEA